MLKSNIAVVNPERDQLRLFVCQIGARMYAKVYRDEAKRDREAQLQQMSATELWYVLENKHGVTMPVPGMFEERLRAFLRAEFIHRIMDIEYGVSYGGEG